jgi:predicted aspartyl protease
MGLTTVAMTVKGPGGRSRTIDMFVDSGAVWSLLPEADWRALGLEPTRTMTFALADGSVIERKTSDCRFAYKQWEAPSPVILGEGDDVALLGVVTLECLALLLNPLDRTLHPMTRLHLMDVRENRRRVLEEGPGSPAS